MNTQTKYWSITWDTNKLQKKLPSEDSLLKFFNRVADDCVFQYEIGSERRKEHVQGVLQVHCKVETLLADFYAPYF
jgi:hypothetical protein